MDDIGRIEADAIRQTEVGNWPLARYLFLQTLTHEMPPLRHAYLERSVAQTYQREGNWREAEMWASMALETLGSVGVPSGGEEAQSLHEWLVSFIPDMTARSGGVY
jgi:hypothetical protein